FGRAHGDARVPTGAFGMPSGEVMPSAGSGETFMRACAWAAPQPNSTAAAAIAKRVISMLLVLVQQSIERFEHAFALFFRSASGTSTPAQHGFILQAQLCSDPCPIGRASRRGKSVCAYLAQRAPQPVGG